MTSTPISCFVRSDICAGTERIDPDYNARLTVRLLFDGCRRQEQGHPKMRATAALAAAGVCATGATGT